MFITCPEFSVYNQGTRRVRTSGWMQLPIEYLPPLGNRDSGESIRYSESIKEIAGSYFRASLWVP